ncbi:MAG: hypothetical protein M5R36_19405 [Deltaproteobacteria bacterium]|nr:hypothetical protein [Deltaproteobacteria bacterium]
MGGLSGQLTTHVRLILKGGYGTNEYKEGDSYEGPLGEAELTGMWEGPTQASLGYRHQVLDATTANYFVSDEIWGRFYKLWMERLATDVVASYQLNQFSSPNERDEHYLQAKAEVTLRMIYWLYLGGGYQHDGRALDNETISNYTVRNIYFLSLAARF